MTDWPKMESMVIVAGGYFESEAFKEIYESLQKEMFDRVQGIPVKVVGLALHNDNSRYCDVLAGETVFSVPIEFVEPVIINKPVDDSEPTSEETKPAKAVEEKAKSASFPFADDSRVDDALLFFARNGYKAWVEDFSYLRGGKLKVEMPKGRT